MPVYLRKFYFQKLDEYKKEESKEAYIIEMLQKEYKLPEIIEGHIAIKSIRANELIKVI